MTKPRHLPIEFLLNRPADCVEIRYTTKENFEVYLHKNVVEVGLKADMTPEAFREAHKKVGAFLRDKKVAHVHLPEIKGALQEQLFALFEGNYCFDRYKSQKSVFISKIYLDALPSNIKEIETILDAQFMMRELLSTPYKDRNVADFVAYAKELLAPLKGVQLEVHDHKWLLKEGMELHYAVGKGSLEIDPPQLVVIKYRGGAQDEPFIGLVGKGMVFDTGGYSLKPSDSMIEMHGDCAGAVLYLHLVYMLDKLGIKKNVAVALPVADNSISSRALRLSDIVIGRSKKSVEITNTDAEGRLILADSVAYLADTMKLNCIITAATLTGAVIIALGKRMAGLFSENSKLRMALLESSERAHEPLWTLPFDKNSFMDLLKSDVADMKNAGKKEASATQGAVFIYQHLIKDIPFAHLDIAGTTMEKSQGTSYGLKLMLDFIRTWKNS